MYSTIVTIVAAIFVILYFRARKQNRDVVLYSIRKAAEADTKYATLKRNYEKSEEGIHEICENYENELLTKNEDIYALTNARNLHLKDLHEKEALIEHHAQHCHGIVEDNVEMIMVRLGHIHPEGEQEKQA